MLWVIRGLAPYWSGAEGRGEECVLTERGRLGPSRCPTSVRERGSAWPRRRRRARRPSESTLPVTPGRQPGEAGCRIEGESSQMRLSERPEPPGPEGRLSLVLPITEGRILTDENLAEYRRILE